MEATSKRIADMIERIQAAIDRATTNTSGLLDRATRVRGMIGMHVRHLLNNLCAEPDTVYLELGLNEGASLIAALVGNESSIRMAYGIDNWYGVRNVKGYNADLEQAFDLNIHRYVSHYGKRFHKITGDLHTMDLSSIANGVTVFYYDADHRQTHKGLMRFLPLVVTPSILLMDDWNQSNVRKGTRAAIAEGGFQVIREWELKADPKTREGTWWQDFYVAAIERVA